LSPEARKAIIDALAVRGEAPQRDGEDEAPAVQ
jgi:hypothetical protein